MRQIIESIVHKLGKEESYHLDESVTGKILWQTIVTRGLSLLRGFWYRLWLQQCKGVLFAGTQLRLRYPQLISIGRSVILEDNVTIDAISKKGVILGNNVTIAKYTTIQCTGVIRDLGVGLIVGNNSAIGAYSFIGAQGGIQIGSNVIMGPRVSIHSENHVFDNSEIPIRLQGESRKGVVVEDDCWIGAGVIILDGVCIKRGSVVAAGSVVTKDIEAFSIYAGVPAKKIKSRKES